MQKQDIEHGASRVLRRLYAEMIHAPGEPESRGDHAPPQLEDELETIHVYPVAGGGILFSKTPLDATEPEALIIESREPEEADVPPNARERPLFPLFLLILCLLLLFDLADSQLTALLTPTITVMITPRAQTISTTATFPLVAEGSTDGVPGRVLPELTLTQSQRTQATGHGHQDARASAGILTFYNGSFSSQTIYAGAIYTGADGVKVATNATVTIPAAIPGSPPQFGQAAVMAHAVLVGASGNIHAGDITITSRTLLVNSRPFAGGQDARDFLLVTKADIERVTDSLTPHVLQSEQAALTSQLTASEALAPPTCTSTVTADRGPGSEATTVQVSVSASCTAVAYDQQAVQVQAVQLLTSMAATHLGDAYHLIGSIQVTVKQATAAHTPIVLLLALVGTWVYAFNPQEQRHIKMLIASKTKPQALQPAHCGGKRISTTR